MKAVGRHLCLWTKFRRDSEVASVRNKVETQVIGTLKTWPRASFIAGDFIN